MSSTASSLINDLSFIQLQITRYAYPIFLVFGVLGCGLNILLFSRKRFRVSSCCIYFLAMSVAMLIHMIWSISLVLYSLNYGDPTVKLLELCKLRIYVRQSTAMIYRWCLTAACFDRFALSSSNVHLRNIAKVEIAIRFVPTMIGIWLVLPIPLLILYNIRGSVCGVVYSSAGALYQSIFTTVTGAALPSTAMFICAILLHRNLRYKQQRRQNAVNHQKNDSERRRLETRSDQQILIMLIGQVFIFLLFMLPLMAVYFYNAVTLQITNKSSEQLAIERFVTFMVELIILMFPVLSFYMHTMMSHMFRTELLNMFLGIFIKTSRGNATRIMPTTNRAAIETLTVNASKIPTVEN